MSGLQLIMDTLRCIGLLITVIGNIDIWKRKHTNKLMQMNWNSGHLDVVKYLIDIMADVNAIGKDVRTAENIASKRGNLEHFYLITFPQKCSWKKKVLGLVPKTDFSKMLNFDS